MILKCDRNVAEVWVVLRDNGPLSCSANGPIASGSVGECQADFTQGVTVSTRVPIVSLK